MLIEAFSNLSKYTVVERTRLNQILAEQKLGLTGAVDPKTAIQLGRLVAANRIVTGSVASIGNFYELNARMTETETGILIKSYSVQVRKDLVQTQ
jgi:curli biogenesis system outer membrane secretion channel CsgG